MINYKTTQNGLLSGSIEIDYSPAHKVFSSIYQDYQHKFLLESKDISHIYGRLSLIGIDPVLKLSGKDNHYKIDELNARSKFYTDKIDFPLEGEIEKQAGDLEESKRSKRQNIAQVIRQLLDTFKVNQKTFHGLYGAFSYDFIRLFEDLGDALPENDTNDFTLFLYDSFIFFDHLKEKSEIILFRENTQEIEKEIATLTAKLDRTAEIEKYAITDSDFSFSQEKYEKLVETAQEYARKGEIFEVVFSNILKAKFDGDPYSLYLKYRDINPSPYLYYFDFGDEQLVGASPEMMVRCEGRIVNLRPISGTAMRGSDPVSDHENMLGLLSDEKERSELDMLIDLGRNDLARVCKPGIKVDDYRFVEKYSRVMHTVAHLSGQLRDDYTALDALISCLNAGTLTGAPKVAAMRIIEKHEEERRGYYGGAIGYLSFSGEMDTGIIIRTAHIKNGQLKFQVGATLLHDSVPASEYQETINKAKAFLETFTN